MTDTTTMKLADALRVLTHDPITRRAIFQIDPKGLAQADEAVHRYERDEWDDKPRTSLTAKSSPNVWDDPHKHTTDEHDEPMCAHLFHDGRYAATITLTHRNGWYDIRHEQTGKLISMALSRRSAMYQGDLWLDGYKARLDEEQGH